MCSSLEVEAACSSAPRSLRPGSEEVLIAFVEGDEQALAIIEAWKFCFPVMKLPPDHPYWKRIGMVTFGTGMVTFG
jgi:hypothetical protein